MSLIDDLFAAAESEIARRPKHPRRPATGHEQPENLYRPFRLVAVFHRTHCIRCDTVTISFEGLFEERRHIRVGDSHMVRQPFIPPPSPLPRVRKYLPADVPYCGACSNLESYMEE